MHSKAITALTLGLAMAVLPAMAHESHAHSGKSVPLAKEQKEWGIAGDAAAVRRTIRITMSDTMRFTPDRVQVPQGEVVRFVVTNAGKMMHEMVIGTRKELDEHAALMEKFPAMAHDEAYMAHVPAAHRSELVWNFNRAGEFEFACLIPGHYQAGMIGRIKVTPR